MKSENPPIKLLYFRSKNPIKLLFFCSCAPIFPIYFWGKWLGFMPNHHLKSSVAGFNSLHLFIPVHTESCFDFFDQGSHWACMMHLCRCLCYFVLQEVIWTINRGVRHLNRREKSTGRICSREIWLKMDRHNL